MKKNDNFWPYSFDISYPFSRTIERNIECNVDITSPKNNDVLIYQDSKWVNQGLSGYSGSSGNTGFSGNSGESGRGITGFGGTSFITLSEKIQMLNKNAEQLLKKAEQLKQNQNTRSTGPC